MSDGEQKEALESEKLLSEIKAEQKAARSKREPIKDIKAAESAQNPPEKVPEPRVEPQAAPDKAGQAVDQVQAQDDKKSGKSDIDYREWASKKGIKDADTAFRSLREMEQRLSRANAELKAREDQNVPRGTIQQPFYQPQPQWTPPPPAYYPPPPGYMDREKVIEQEAKRYNMAPEDFERVLALSNDIADMKTRRVQAQFEQKLEEINRETKRNSELRELMQDPLFVNKQVQFEMHKIFEENPRAFSLEPSPYLYAFNEAQRRLARKYLQEGISEQDEGRNVKPTKPPNEDSKGSGQSFERTPDDLISDQFSQAKTSEEQRKILTSLGAVQSQ